MRPTSPGYLDADHLSAHVQDAVGRPLTEQERAEIELWRKGRDIATLVNHPGWHTILEMLQEYATEALRQAMGVAPGDNDRVLAAHAVAYALNDFYTKFRQDVDAAVQAARTTPEVMTRGLRGPGPVESLY